MTNDYKYDRLKRFKYVRFFGYNKEYVTRKLLHTTGNHYYVNYKGRELSVYASVGTDNYYLTGTGGRGNLRIVSLAHNK